MKEKVTPEEQEHHNQLILGDLINHVKFWIFMGCVVLYLSHMFDFIISIQNFFKNMTGA